MSGEIRSHYKNLGLASLGAVLENYDFVVFVFIAAALSKTFFPPDVSPWIAQIQTFSIYAVGYLIRPVAGITMAHFADRIGRKKLFVFNVLLMSLPTFAIGLLPTYAQVGILAPILLTLMRMLQGCAMGGEIPSAAVFVSEHAPPDRLGVFSGTLHLVQHAGLLLGMGGAALAGLIAGLNPDMASLNWRLPFLLGGALGLTAAYLRRRLQETPLFEKLREGREITQRAPLGVVLSQHGKACLIGLGLLCMMSLTVITYFQYMVTYLITNYHVPQSAALAANIVGVIALAAPMPLWGWFSDRFGPRNVVVAGSLVTALVTVWFFTVLPSYVDDIGSLVLLFIPVGMSTGIVVALVPGLISSLFPTAVRQSGYAVPYNIGAAVFAGLTPLTLSVLVRNYGLVSPMYFLLAACAVGLLTGLALAGVRRYLGTAATLGSRELLQAPKPFSS